MQHDFAQTDNEVWLTFQLPAEVQKGHIKTTFSYTHATVKLGQTVAFDDDLLGRIDPDESTWEYDRGKHALKVVLVKEKANAKWIAAGKKDAEKVRAEAGADVDVQTLTALDPDNAEEVGVRFMAL